MKLSHRLWRRFSLFGVFVTVCLIATSASTDSADNMAVCVGGEAAGHACSRIDLASRLRLSESGAKAERGNDIWGWTDPQTNREYAIMGLSSKTSFVDVTDPSRPVHIGDLMTATHEIIWRDIKVYDHYAFIVSEAYDHGMQIFDLHN